MADRQRSIGVFDSGIGGLTVVHALLHRLPKESVVYFGDTARVPYGSRSHEVVRQYAMEDARFLMEQDVKMIVVACNTVSSIAIDDLKRQFSVPVIGMILPGSHAALRVTKNKHVGVIGTLGTIASGSYTRAIQELDAGMRVSSTACPLFVPLAEEGWGHHPIARLVAEEYLATMKKQEIDTLILGCTHYPILRNVIQSVMGQKVWLVDSGEAAAVEVEESLRENDLLNDSETAPNYQFFVSDVPQKFKELGEIFLGKTNLRVTKVHL